MHKVEFVHIPKSGGTALERALPASCGIHGSGHARTASNVTSKGTHALVVIREPEDRFRSAFSYWKYGSKDQRQFMRKGNHAPSEKLPTVGQFIDAASNPGHKHHQVAQNALNKRDKFTWNVHFKDQAHWLDGDPTRPHIVCYNESNLAESVSDTLKRDLGVQCDLSHVKKVNVTKKKSEDALNSNQVKWLRNRYKHDFDLWETHCGNI